DARPHSAERSREAFARSPVADAGLCRHRQARTDPRCSAGLCFADLSARGHRGGRDVDRRFGYPALDISRLIVAKFLDILYYSAGDRFDEIGIAAAIVIAAASVLQAAVGGSVLRRAVGYPTRLDRGRELSGFLLLSPTLCLMSTTLSLSGLLALGVVELPELATSWVSWWIGDTL